MALNATRFRFEGCAEAVEGAIAAPRPAASATLVLLEADDAALEEEDAAFAEEDGPALLDDADDLEEVDTARAGLGMLELEEDGEAVGLPTGTPRPALIESMRFVYDVVATGTTTDGFGRPATEPPFHFATVSSPIR